MADSTNYTAENTPELAVRQILLKSRAPENLGVALANLGFIDPDSWSAIADFQSDFKEAVKGLVTEADLSVDERSRNATLILLTAAWKKCTALASCLDTRRARLEEDPHRIPEIGVQDHSQMRTNFQARHPDVILVDFKEPPQALH